MVALAMVTRSVGGACGCRRIVGCKVQVPDKNLTVITYNVPVSSTAMQSGRSSNTH
jgi:hypothetical protein